MTKPSITLDGSPVPTEMAEAALAAYFDAREHRRAAERRMEAPEAILKAWLSEHPGESLRHGELGLRARLQERQMAGSLDYSYMTNEEIVYLARSGCLQAVGTAALAAITKANGPAGDIIAKHLKPGGITTALVVTDK